MTSRPTTSLRSIFLYGVALLVVATAGTAIYRGKQLQPEAPESQWLYIQPQVLESHLGLVGRIEAAEHAVLAAPFEAVIKDISVKEGMGTQRGQPLVTLDTTQVDIQIRDALSALLTAKRSVQELGNWENGEEMARARRVATNARLSLDDTTARLADTTHLFERGIVARMEVDALKQQAVTQRLDLLASESELKAVRNKGRGEARQIADMELANAEARYKALTALHAQRIIHSPFSGIALPPKATEKNTDAPIVQPGLRVSQGTPLLEVASLERINAVARIEEADLHELKEGMQVDVTGDGFSGISLKGHIQSIGIQGAPATFGGGVTYDVVVAIDPLTPDQQRQLRLGMSAKIAITTYRSDQGLAVPAEAIHQNEDGSTFVTYRSSMNVPARQERVRTGRAVPQGVEVFGISSGYIEVNRL